MQPATTFQEAVVNTQENANKLLEFVHGSDTTTVQTDNGPLPSLAKFLKDKDTQINTGAGSILAGANSAATAASGSATAAANALKDFRKGYYGSLANDPTVDPYGDPVTEGDFYFNSTTKAWKVYSGTNWYTTNLTAADFANGSDLSKGVSLVAGAIRTVASITALRTVPAGSNPVVDVTSYYGDNAGGGGRYAYVPGDTTTPDDGGLVIVGASGARWALVAPFGPFSVKHFGAKGDGVDDTAAFRAALAKASGRSVQVPAGVYAITGALTLKSGTTLKGDGSKASIVKMKASFSASDNMVVNENRSGAVGSFSDQSIFIQDIGFDGSANTARMVAMFAFNQVDGLKLNRCEFYDHSFVVVDFGACRDAEVSDCTFTRNGRPRPSSVASPCIYADTGSWGTPYNIRVERNIFRNNNGAFAHFMPVGGSFSLNQCVGNGETGLYAGPNGLNLRIIGNHIEGQVRSNTSGSGMEIAARQVVVADNTITGNAGDGIRIVDAQGVVVHDNIVFNNGQETAYFTASSGIAVVSLTASVDAATDHVRIHSNRVGDKQATKTQVNGISVSGTGLAAKRLCIHDNDLTDQKTTSLSTSLSLSDGCYTRDNHVNGGALQAPFKTLLVRAPTTAGFVAYLGVGFKPRAIEIDAMAPAFGGGNLQSRGSWDSYSAGQAAVWGTSDPSGNSGGVSADRIVSVCNSSGIALCDAAVSAFGNDGFSLYYPSVAIQPWLIIRCYP